MAGKTDEGKNNSKTTKTPSSRVQTIDAQENSQLFRIPQEVRDMIYAELFIDTRLSHGRGFLEYRSGIRIVPAANALSMLRSCRRARAEIGDSWLGQVLFSFEDAITMLTKLTALPIAILSKIRYMCIREETWLFYLLIEEVYYRLIHILKLLPGLRLDTLTVLNRFGNDAASYDTLNMLIKYGQGWKELRYISNTSSLLGFARDPEDPILPAGDGIDDRYRRKLQPADWIRAMNNRDGAASQPSVTIYRSTLAAQTCTVTDEATRVQYEQELPKPGEEDTLETQKYSDLMSPWEIYKELMVVVRRGRGIDYQEKPGSPFLPVIGDIRRDYLGMTWETIKKRIPHPDENDEDRTQRDTYRHADDYQLTFRGYGDLRGFRFTYTF